MPLTQLIEMPAWGRGEICTLEAIKVLALGSDCSRPCFAPSLLGAKEGRRNEGDRWEYKGILCVCSAAAQAGGPETARFLVGSCERVAPFDQERGYSR